MAQGPNQLRPQSAVQEALVSAFKSFFPTLEPYLD